VPITLQTSFHRSSLCWPSAFIPALHSSPSLCHPSLFNPRLFAPHLPTLHSRPSLPPFTPALHPAVLHASFHLSLHLTQPALPPFTVPPVTLHSASLHPSLLASISFVRGTHTPRIAHSARWGWRISFVWASRRGDSRFPLSFVVYIVLRSEGTINEIQTKPNPSLLYPLLPPFTPPPFTPALHCAALHRSPRRPSLPPFNSHFIPPLLLHPVGTGVTPSYGQGTERGYICV
jgi:hypothetical protein